MLIAKNLNARDIPSDEKLEPGEAIITGFPSRQNVNVTELFEDIRKLSRNVQKKVLAEALAGLTEPEIVEVISEQKITPEVYNIYLGLKNSLR